MSESLKNIVLSKLYYLDIIKYGTFTLKNGSTSSIYVDFRKLVNYPQLFKYLEELIDIMFPHLLDYNSSSNTKLMPIPMGGLPLGHYLSFAKEFPQLMIRDKPKDHGTKRLIEGVYSAEDDEFIIVEDVVTSGTSIKETLKTFAQYNIAGLKFKAILCICNRGHLNNIEGIPIYSIFTLDEIQEYVAKLHNREIIPYFGNQSTFSNELYSIALQKKCNIILSCDFMSSSDILALISKVGMQIVAIKLHLDAIVFNQYVPYHYEDFLCKLRELKFKYNFLIIEDAKFADIDAIMVEKIHSGRLMIAGIADAITIHAIAGLSILKNKDITIPMIIVSEMSSSNNMITTDYYTRVMEQLRAIENPSLLGGLVCQQEVPKLMKPFEYVTMSPGINLEQSADSGNQRYGVPDKNNNKVGLFWIVGRGITAFKDNSGELEHKMELYRGKGWDYFIVF